MSIARKPHCQPGLSSAPDPGVQEHHLRRVPVRVAPPRHRRGVLHPGAPTVALAGACTHTQR